MTDSPQEGRGRNLDAAEVKEGAGLRDGRRRVCDQSAQQPSAGYRTGQDIVAVHQIEQAVSQFTILIHRSECNEILLRRQGPSAI